MISLKTKEELRSMAEGGRMLSEVMKELKKNVAPGIREKELDALAGKLIKEKGAQIAFQGYHGFPGNICVSVNEQVVHGVPTERTLKEGDIVSLDIGLIWKGLYLDMARTFPVGKVDPEASRLVRVAKTALRLGVKKAKPGNTIGDLGNTIQRYVEGQGYGIVRELCGHGIGRDLHEDPQIPNYGQRKTGEKLKEGMVICIEPMITAGAYHLKLEKDGQTYSTRDEKLSAHFEDTIAITASGPKVLTRD
ncbi:MAG: type I methionyl aminopeptidase [Candidatus Yanofskybacteria bacterium]|nr:type I methionyl aminopeptidase [Candidatus Yanofskybacteria bacterium]